VQSPDGCDLNHRLQPIEPARSGPDDFNGNAAFASGLFQRQCHFIGADRNRAGINCSRYQ
jgi:hypothetical protein